MLKLKDLCKKNDQSQQFNFQILENHHICKKAFYGWLTISHSILTLHTPTIYQTIGNYLRILQNFSNMSYDVYVRSYELPNSSHFPPQTLQSLQSLTCFVETTWSSANFITSVTFLGHGLGNLVSPTGKTLVVRGQVKCVPPRGQNLLPVAVN